MKSKKPSLYDAQEEQIQLQSASFVDFLTRKGVLEDHNIDNERVRKAKKDTAQRAYHNTEVLLSQYRLIIWVLECIPGELSDELEVPVHDIDALAEKIDIQDHLVRLLQPQEDTKYILVVPNMEFANKLILPDAPCLFATVDQTECEAPKITFYSS